MNVICIYLILIQTGLCVVMSVYSGFFTQDYSSYAKYGLRRKAEYIFYKEP